MKTLKNYKVFNLPSLTSDQLEEIDKLIKKNDKSIDLESIPELTDEQFASGHFAYANSLKLKKTSIHFMIDEDNLEWLKNQGKGYQPRLNKVLRWARLNNCPIEKM